MNYLWDYMLIVRLGQNGMKDVVLHVTAFLRAFCRSPWCDALVHAQTQWLKGCLRQMFGYVGVQIGAPFEVASAWQSCKVARHLVLADTQGPEVMVISGSHALPLKRNTVDVAVLVHALETAADPYALLREVERALVTDGHLLVTGFLPANCWWAQWFGQHRRGVQSLSLYGPGRVVDWLQALGFQIEEVVFFPSSGWRRWLPWLAPPCRQGYGVLAQKKASQVRLIGLRQGWRWRLAVPQATAGRSSVQSADSVTE